MPYLTIKNNTLLVIMTYTMKLYNTQKYLKFQNFVRTNFHVNLKQHVTYKMYDCQTKEIKFICFQGQSSLCLRSPLVMKVSISKCVFLQLKVFCAFI